MKYLPSKKYEFTAYQKLNTYLTLSHIGCPVFKSVVINNDDFSFDDVKGIKHHLQSEFCTIRYQYTKPTASPVRGGNKIPLHYDTLCEKIVPNTLLWLLEPIDRLKNTYGINMLFDRRNRLLTYECVGRGFDVSDLNRGDASPHQRIEFRLPIDYGWFNEWWKFAKFKFVSNENFDASKIIRLKKLSILGLSAGHEIFDLLYNPLSLPQIERLLGYSQLISDFLVNEEGFVVSCSIDDARKIVFWDIQTPLGKMKILGG